MAVPQNPGGISATPLEGPSCCFSNSMAVLEHTGKPLTIGVLIPVFDTNSSAGDPQNQVK